MACPASAAVRRANPRFAPGATPQPSALPALQPDA